MLHRFEEELIAIPLACALNGEDKVVPSTAQLHFAIKFGVPQALSADRVPHGVFHHSLELPDVALILAAFGSLLLGHLLKTNDSLGEAVGKLLRIRSEDRPCDLDSRHETVRGGGHGGELGVVGAHALVHVHLEADSLPRAQLGDENIRVCRRNGVLPTKVLLLVAAGDKLNVAGVHMGVVVGLERVRLGRVGVLVDGAGDVEVELDRVKVEAVGVRILAGLGLLVPAEEVVQALAAALEGNQTETVGEDLILDDGRVVRDEDILNGEGGDLGEEDASEGVGERGVDADEREGGEKRVVLVELDIEARPEPLNGELCVFSGYVAGEIDRGVVRDGFFSNLHSL